MVSLPLGRPKTNPSATQQEPTLPQPMLMCWPEVEVGVRTDLHGYVVASLFLLDLLLPLLPFLR